MYSHITVAYLYNITPRGVDYYIVAEEVLVLVVGRIDFVEAVCAYKQNHTFTLCQKFVDAYLSGIIIKHVVGLYKGTHLIDGLAVNDMI